MNSLRNILENYEKKAIGIKWQHKLEKDDKNLWSTTKIAVKYKEIAVGVSKC